MFPWTKKTTRSSLSGPRMGKKLFKDKLFKDRGPVAPVLKNRKRFVRDPNQSSLFGIVGGENKPGMGNVPVRTAKKLIKPRYSPPKPKGKKLYSTIDISESVVESQMKNKSRKKAIRPTAHMQSVQKEAVGAARSARPDSPRCALTGTFRRRAYQVTRRKKYIKTPTGSGGAKNRTDPSVRGRKLIRTPRRKNRKTGKVFRALMTVVTPGVVYITA